MTKICGNLLVRILSLLFKKSFDNSYLPELWTKYYVSPQKSSKKKFKNYRTLLPIFSKVFEKIIFNKMSTFLQNEQLLNPNQSGFHP